MSRAALRLSPEKKFALAAAGAVVLAVPVLVGIMNGQPPSTPKFEVAAIKACVDSDGRGAGTKSGGRGGDGSSASPGSLNICRTVASLIQFAYVNFANGVRNPPSRVPITGGPAWISSERYQINAKAEEAASLEMMEGPMLQALLEDRFKLKIHRETREVPVFDLTVAKGGLKVQRSNCIPAPAPPARPESGQKVCGGLYSGGKGPNYTLEIPGTVAEFSNLLATILGRPVIDKTGLTATFDFRIEYAPDESTPGMSLRLAPSDDPPGLSIFTAMQEQLGLKLDSAKGPGEFLVIDSVEKPSEN